MARKNLLEQVFLVPYSHLPDSYYRFLELTLPSVHVLGFIRQPYCPPWDRGTIATCLLSLEGEKAQSLNNVYKGYQEFAKIHGERHLLETISLTKTQDEWEESRPHLRSMLKTAETASSDQVWSILVESIIFLELARELDERDIEVDNDLFKVKELENLFASSLGIETEDDLDEVEEPVRVVVEELPRRSYFGYLTKSRMSHWLRTYFARLPFVIRRCNIAEERSVVLGRDLPILLCVSRDSAEELIDPIRTKEERTGLEWSPDTVTLLEVPNIFETISDDSFYELNTYLAHSTVDFWKGLQDYIDNPQNRSSLIEAASNVNELLKQWTIRLRSRVPSRFRLSVVFHPSMNIIRAWQLIDGAGYRALEHLGLPEPEPLPILIFEELENTYT